MKREQITNAHANCIAMLLHRSNKTPAYIHTLYLLPAQRSALYSAFYQIKHQSLNRGAESTEEIWCESYCILVALRKMRVHVKSLSSADLAEWM